MAAVVEFKLRVGPHAKGMVSPYIDHEEARIASGMADLCLEIAERPFVLPAWAIAMTKDEHARFAQDLIDMLTKALDLYQCTFPKQDVCLDERGRDRGWFDLRSIHGVVTVCVFCRNVIYRDEAAMIEGPSGRIGGIGTFDREPPSKVSDEHRRRAEYHGLACACLFVAGLLSPKSGKALGAVIA